jgi:hypothetical protein
MPEFKFRSRIGLYKWSPILQSSFKRPKEIGFIGLPKAIGVCTAGMSTGTIATS